MESDSEISAVIHFDKVAEQITVEDPQFIFFIRNIPWKSFASELGFMGVEFKNRYDFALSFAGEDRPLAEALFTELEAAEVEVFYDKNEPYARFGHRGIPSPYLSIGSYLRCCIT